MSHKYEIHAHTAETSLCSMVTGAGLADFYHGLGYTGLFVTDHFFNGNTTVPRKGPWEKRVALFHAGFEAAAERGATLGLDIFFGWEYSIQGCDFLTLGLDRGWLLANPDVEEWPPSEYFDRVHDAGGVIIHAHPFRRAAYIPCIQLYPDHTDAVEVYNASMTPEVNGRAQWYADSYGLAQAGGSDTHSTAKTHLAAMVSPKRLAGAAEFTGLLRSRQLTIESVNLVP